MSVQLIETNDVAIAIPCRDAVAEQGERTVLASARKAFRRRLGRW
jgi:hypothetical protein